MFEASSDTECELPAGGIDFRKLSEQVMTHLFQNPRSGWKHKAWGGAKRNPRVTKRNQTERAERATGQALRFTVMKGYRPLSWAFRSHSNDPWGTASLHPRLY